MMSVKEGWEKTGGGEIGRYNSSVEKRGKRRGGGKGKNAVQSLLPSAAPIRRERGKRGVKNLGFFFSRR